MADTVATHGANRNSACCRVIATLAAAAEAIVDHDCCCEAAKHEAGCDCCEASMKLILDAMDLHTKCLRDSCCKTT